MPFRQMKNRRFAKWIFANSPNEKSPIRQMKNRQLAK